MERVADGAERLATDAPVPDALRSNEAVDEQISRTREGLARWGECARRGDRDAFVQALEREARSAGGDEVSDRFFFAVAADQMFAGLERYWRKHALDSARTPA